MASKGVPTDRKITRNDIEDKLNEIKGEVDTAGNQAKPYALGVAIAGVLAVAGLAYVMGRRRGRKKTTVVEVRRV